MDRTQLEHVLRAAAAITGADRFFLIGSQSIVGAVPNPPAELLHSMEVDVFTDRSPQDSDLIDGSIGEGSPFHTTFGYHAHGVAEETAVLPSGWRERLVPFTSEATGGAVALCLEPNDLAVSKLAAGREKDIAYVSAMLRHGLAQESTVRTRIAQTPLNDGLRQTVLSRLERSAKC
jgi:hypothetical protein